MYPQRGRLAQFRPPRPRFGVGRAMTSGNLEPMVPFPRPRGPRPGVGLLGSAPRPFGVSPMRSPRHRYPAAPRGTGRFPQPPHARSDSQNNSVTNEAVRPGESSSLAKVDTETSEEDVSKKVPATDQIAASDLTQEQTENEEIQEEALQQTEEPDHGTNTQEEEEIAEGMGNEEAGGNEEEEEEEEDTGFCKYCNVSFSSSDTYWKHTRGLLHTQKLMEAEGGHNTDQGKNTAPQGSEQRNPFMNPDIYQAKNKPKDSLSFGENTYNLYKKKKDSGQQQQPAYQHYRNAEYYDNRYDNKYGEQQKGYEDEGGGGEDGYDFNSSNWMEMGEEEEEPTPKIPLSERDYTPEELGKSQFPDEFFCKVCDIRCTGAVTFKMHVEGSRHKAKVEAMLVSSGLPNLDGKELFGPNQSRIVETTREARLNTIATKYDVPLIGLQFVTEFQKTDPKGSVRYVCNLCESKCDGNTIIAHLSGVKHRMAFIKHCKPEVHANITSHFPRGKKSEISQATEECAKDIERQEGRGKVKVKIEIDHATEKATSGLLQSGGIHFDDLIEKIKGKSGASSDAESPLKKPRFESQDDLLLYAKVKGQSHMDSPLGRGRGQRPGGFGMGRGRGAVIDSDQGYGGGRGGQGGHYGYNSGRGMGTAPDPYGRTTIGSGDNTYESQYEQMDSDPYGGGQVKVFDYGHKNTRNQQSNMSSDYSYHSASYGQGQGQFDQGQGGYENTANYGYQGHPAEVGQGQPQGQSQKDHVRDEDAELFQQFLKWKKQQNKLEEEKKEAQKAPSPRKSKPKEEETTPNVSDLLLNLSNSMINTEEEAAMALQVSNALTQALLQYRLKNVPKELKAGLVTDPQQGTKSRSSHKGSPASSRSHVKDTSESSSSRHKAKLSTSKSNSSPASAKQSTAAVAQGSTGVPTESLVTQVTNVAVPAMYAYSAYGYQTAGQGHTATAPVTMVTTGMASQEAQSVANPAAVIPQVYQYNTAGTVSTTASLTAQQPQYYYPAYSTPMPSSTTVADTSAAVTDPYASYQWSIIPPQMVPAPPSTEPEKPPPPPPSQTY